MKSDYTHITLVVDRSGSMSTCKVEAEGGINAFIKDQQAQPGEASLTLVQFDNQYETVYNGLPLRAIDHPYVLEPRGFTALNDAVGRAIVDTGEFLSAIPEAARPGLVVFAIVTDGAENASRIYSRAQIRDMIKHQEEAYQWRFDYLGANQDAFAVAQTMGLTMDSALQYETQTSGSAYASLSGKTATMRHMASKGLSTQSVGYSDAQRAASVGIGIGPTSTGSKPSQEALDALKKAATTKS